MTGSGSLEAVYAVYLRDPKPRLRTSPDQDTRDMIMTSSEYIGKKEEEDVCV